MTRRLRINPILMVAIAACADAVPRATADDAKRSVQEFYAWYVPIARTSSDASMRAIRERADAFDRPIVEGLRADSVAIAGPRSAAIGLDSDPFLRGHEPCERYDAVSASENGEGYLVSVLGSGRCKPHETPDIVVEVTRQRGRLVFKNFRYSNARNDDLLAQLASLRSARTRSKTP